MAEEIISTENISEAKQVRMQKLAALVEAGQDPFVEVKFDKTHSSEEIKANAEALNEKEVTIAGRLVSRRIMGEASFAHLLDGEGKIQIYVRRDDIGENEYMAFKQLDIGDIIGVKGFVFRTQTGEISVHAKEYKLLSKSLLPLPEKFHGLQDTDLRYRQRYVDLIANPEVKEVFIKRSKIISTIREVLDKKGFIEVETPVLNTLAGGANARPFVTHHNTLDIDMYMRIATELQA